MATETISILIPDNKSRHKTPSKGNSFGWRFAVYAKIEEKAD